MGNLMARLGQWLINSEAPGRPPGDVANDLAGAIRGIVNPILIVVGSLAALLAIWLGVRLATAQDESKRKEAKAQLIWAIIAVIVVFAMVSVFYIVFPAQTD
ncbi:MAG: pilin [Firmicutes bacterium]|nr:pilin [Bacillota bacterium]